MHNRVEGLNRNTVKVWMEKCSNGDCDPADCPYDGCTGKRCKSRLMSDALFFLIEDENQIDKMKLTIKEYEKTQAKKENLDEEQDRTGNNGPIRAIVAEDVLVKLNKLATGGILADEWRNVIMDAFTLIWMRHE